MNEGAITSSTRRQPTVALSTTEAEITAAVTAVTVGLRSMYEDIFNKLGITPNYSDNKRGNTSEEQRGIEKNKRYRYKASIHRSHGEIKIEYLRRDNMVANILTKNTPGSIIEKHLISMDVKL